MYARVFGCALVCLCRCEENNFVCSYLMCEKRGDVRILQAAGKVDPLSPLDRQLFSVLGKNLTSNG